MEKVLSALKDINGVVGSFVLQTDGALLSREMPTLYPDTVFPEIGRRLEAVSEALATQRAGYSEMLLKFEGYWLLSRRTVGGSLNILTTDTVNYPALRMATNVALRQIEDKMATAVPMEMAVAPADPSPTPIAVAAEVPKKRRIWRGQVVD